MQWLTGPCAGPSGTPANSPSFRQTATARRTIPRPTSTVTTYMTPQWPLPCPTHRLARETQQLPARPFSATDATQTRTCDWSGGCPLRMRGSRSRTCSAAPPVCGASLSTQRPCTPSQRSSLEICENETKQCFVTHRPIARRGCIVCPRGRCSRTRHHVRLCGEHNHNQRNGVQQRINGQ